MLSNETAGLESHQTGEREVFADVASRNQALRFSIFRQQADPRIDRIARRFHIDGLPVDTYGSGCFLIGTEDQASCFRPTSAHKPRHTENFSAANLKGNVLHHVISTKPGHFQNRRSRHSLRALELPHENASNHQFNQATAS